MRIPYKKCLKCTHFAGEFGKVEYDCLSDPLCPAGKIKVGFDPFDLLTECQNHLAKIIAENYYTSDDKERISELNRQVYNIIKKFAKDKELRKFLYLLLEGTVKKAMDLILGEAENDSESVEEDKLAGNPPVSDRNRKAMPLPESEREPVSEQQEEPNTQVSDTQVTTNDIVETIS